MKSGSLPVLGVPRRDSRRSVIVVLDADGTELCTHRIHTGYENRRVKNDQEDAQLLADLLRMGHLPEAWIAPKSNTPSSRSLPLRPPRTMHWPWLGGALTGP